MSEQALVKSDIQPSMSEDAISASDVFLLNPANRAFLLGKSRRIGDRLLLNEMLPFIALIPFILLGLWGLIRCVSAVAEWSRLNQPEAALTTGTIVERHTSTAKSTSYFITYNFNASDQAFRRDQVVSLDTYSRLIEGSLVAVKYLPDDPQISALGGSNTDNTYVVSLTIAMVIFIPLLVLMLVAMRNMLRQMWPLVERKRQLVHKGKVLKGQVLSSFGTERGSNYRVTVRYSYRSPKGSEVVKMASRKRNDLKETDLPKAGTPVAVLYVDSKCLELL